MTKGLEEHTATAINPTWCIAGVRASSRYATAHLSVLTAPWRIAVESVENTHELASTCRTECAIYSYPEGQQPSPQSLSPTLQD